MLSETVVLLNPTYKTIPSKIKINALPTSLELEYVGAEDFDSTMVRTVLPQVVEDSEDMDFGELLEIDYEWVCRCLRMKTYGPYFTTNRIYCPDCNKAHEGQYQVDLTRVGINPLPDNFVNRMTISSDEFIDVEDDFTVQLMTIRDHMAMVEDKLFQRPNGTRNISLSRLCYMIKKIGSNDNLNPIDVKSYIINKMSAADYELLKSLVSEYDNYGLQITGRVKCPVCGCNDAYFIALQQDKFFRPSVGDLKLYRSSVRSKDWKNFSGNPADYVR